MCRALAKKHGLKCSGRRNQLGNMIGKRSCEWQSGTLPVFAVLFRSNSHTLPNSRAPVLDITHEDSLCNNKKCKESLQKPGTLKSLAKLAQRVCRECTGYHSGYTFKKQPIGVKYLDAAAETLNYVVDGMEAKTGAQKYHYMTHRMLQDLQHRCITRTMPEESNLAANWDEHDVKKAEFIRTYLSVDFRGSALLRRYESEISEKPSRDLRKVLPKVGDKEVDEDLYLRCFDDIYGFRGKNEGFSRHVFFLNPWEFLMLWECKPLPKPPSPLVRAVKDAVEPNPKAESDDILFFS